MIDNTTATIGPADDLGRKADPVLKQLAETVGAELLHYRPPSPQATSGRIEEETRGGEYDEWEWVFLQDPDGLLVTLDFPLYPTRVNWFLPTAELPIQRPLSEAADMLDVPRLLNCSRSIKRSCVSALLNTQQWHLQNVSLPAWLEEEVSQPDAQETRGGCVPSSADGIRLSDRSIAVGPEQERERRLEVLAPAARTWAEDVVAALSDAYSNEIPRWMWDKWRQPPSAPLRLVTKIPLHLHVLLDDGSSWILPGLRRPSSRKSRCQSDRRVAFRRWLADVGGRPVAVLLINPRMFAPQIFPSFGAQLHTETCEVQTIMAPNVDISWAACERRAETVGLVATPVRVT